MAGLLVGGVVGNKLDEEGKGWPVKDGAVIGAFLGEGVGFGLGAHAGDPAGKSGTPQLLWSVGISAGGLAAAYLMNSGTPLIVVLPVQIVSLSF